ncbi:7-methylguanosine phosphate-specific 5'-nucleotidase [Coccinella septempunctata]|uniref:7-methylguanosine phosphate-specific 5'-nucleotidase n=1 Tax=Coccinella septempunctata TaxID=41139 RepID=UPI001D084BC9|nr:7-methylguanosine phosphate-specific 5'-nucleotidase [Coccinella septempunctata]
MQRYQKMVRDLVSDIKLLNRVNVHIKDKTRVNEILGKIVEGGFKQLQIVSDFDQTITKQHENGKKHLSSFGIFRCCPSLPKEHVELTDSFARKYKPIECDLTIPIEERKKHMEEWYSDTEKSLKGIEISPEEISDIAKKYGPCLRDGCKKIFQSLEEKNVPVLVFSAGLGDTVVALLKHNGIYRTNVKVVSNFLDFDKNNVVQGFQGKLIHIYSKNEHALEGTDYFKLISQRNNVILLGDSIGDAGMADGLPNTNAVLKIGFLYFEKDLAEKKLSDYLNYFDIVLEDDQTMDVLGSILALLE